MAAEERLRLFVAIAMPAAAQAELERAANALRGLAPGDTRWSDLRGAHLTLKFIGATPAGDAALLGVALAAGVAGREPFELSLGGVGVFPGRGSPRVLWVGVDGATGRLTQLRDDVEQALTAAGCAPEEQAFSPHLTVARIAARLKRDESVALRRAVEGVAVAPERFVVDEVVLYRSDLRASGAVYTRLLAARLGG